MANVTYQALLAAVDDLLSFVGDIGKELSAAQEAAVLAREHVAVTIAGRLGLDREILVPSGDWPAWQRTRTGLFIGPLWKRGLAADWAQGVQQFRAMVAELSSDDSCDPTAGPAAGQATGPATGQGASDPAEPTKVYLTSWSEILATLKLKRGDREKIARLNTLHGGPILTGGQGEQPMAERGELIAWHEGLAVRLQELRSRRADRQATAADGYEYGKGGSVALGGIGSVKKRRRDRKP